MPNTGYMFFRLVFLVFIFSSHISVAESQQHYDTAYVRLLSEKAEKAMLYAADSGLYYASKLMEYAAETGTDLTKAAAHEKFGWSFWVKGNYAEGLKHSLEAIRILETYPPSQLLATALLGAGRNLFEQRSYSLALSYYTRAEQAGLEQNLETVLLEVYRDIGGINVYTGNYDQGIDYCEKGVALAKKLGERSSIPIFYSHMALMHEKKGDLDQAIDYNWRAVLEGRLVGNRRVVAVCFERLASIDIANRQYDEAIRKGYETLEMSKEIGSSLLVMRAYHMLAKAYEGKKEFERSLEFYKQYSIINDSTYNASKESIIASIEAVYKLEQKQQEIALLEKENALNIQAGKAQQYYFFLSMLLIILLIVLILVLYKSFIVKNRHNHQLQTKNEEIGKQARKLADMNATKSKIFSIIGHDLRSSLANLKQLMSLISTHNVTMKELKSITPTIKQSVDSSFDVLDNLLHWGLSQMDGIQTNMHGSELHPLVEEIANHFSVPVEQKNIHLKCEVAPGQLVMADGSQLSVVIRNLVANAIKFTKPGGEVCIKAEEKAKLVRISVIDSGVGISEEKLKLLFKSGGHFSEAGTAQEKGSGLGLLLCKEFLENMGSRLQVSSSLGKGSAFYFDLQKANIHQVVH